MYYSIWCGYIARLSQEGGRGYFTLLKLFLPAPAAATGGGGIESRQYTLWLQPALEAVAKSFSEILWRLEVVHKSGSCTAISSRAMTVINPPELVTGTQSHLNPARVWIK
jgi:hypothetical protein